MVATPEQLELSVLSSITSLEDLEKYKELGIDDASFVIDELANVWEYVNKRAVSGEYPTKADIRAACGIELIKDVTDKDILVEELSKLTMQRKATSAILSNSKALQYDPEATIRKLIGDLGEITRARMSHVTYFDADAEKRLIEVRNRIERRSKGLFVGIPTGLACFDDTGDLYQEGELIAIIGTTTVGKSWLTLYSALYGYYYANKRVLFLSPESTNFEIEARMDSIMGRFMGYELSNRGIMKGTIDLSLYEKYLTEVALTKRKDWKTRDSGDSGVFTLNDIISQAREYRPDILCIDGFHLIKGLGSSWENMKSAAETIKGQAQHLGMVVIAGSQAQREAAMAIDDTPELGQVAYGMGLVETANRVITLVEKKGDQQQRIFKVPKMRGGEKILTRKYLKFNVDVGEIYQMNPEIDEETGEVSF